MQDAEFFKRHLDILYAFSISITKNDLTATDKL